MIEPSGPSILDFVGDPVISLDPLADSPIAHIRPGSNIELTSHLIWVFEEIWSRRPIGPGGAINHWTKGSGLI